MPNGAFLRQVARASFSLRTSLSKRRIGAINVLLIFSIVVNSLLSTCVFDTVHIHTKQDSLVDKVDKVGCTAESLCVRIDQEIVGYSSLIALSLLEALLAMQ